MDVIGILFPKEEPLTGRGEIGVFVTLKAVFDSADWLPTLTDITEWVELAGTVTTSEVALALITVALVLPKNTVLFTAVELKLVPVIVTEAPTAALEGENDVIVGGGVGTLKFQEEVLFPKFEVSVTGPVVAPAGTTAVI